MLTPADEIKQRLDIVDVISEYIQLRLAGLTHSAGSGFRRQKNQKFSGGAILVLPSLQNEICR